MSFVCTQFVVRTNWFAGKFCNCFYTVNWFQLLQSNTTNLIQYYSFAYRQWSSYKYCYSTLIILLNIIYSFAYSQMVPSIALLKQYFNLDTQAKSFKCCY